ncbi:MAG: acetate--CoA ligase family protein [Gammaproteobacteria bacterium]|nr:acetate--CoA ligase family protein [Gammaproteobacteria bacterium]MYK82142.1 acetate--CoA ligase family protein [Gammaproteobacteria bacterium]
MAASADLKRLLRPNSIAVIGGLAAARVVEQCDRMAFSGEVWPVHPQRKEVAGRRAFRTIEDLPQAPDAAFVGVNRHAAIEAVAALSERGAGGAICYASGFQEASDGAALQRELLQVAGTMPLVGPNCYGLLNLADGVPLWPDQHGGERLPANGRGVAIITQSSNIAISLTMQQRGLPIAYVATAGNQAQLGVSALATALLDDERVSALGLHVEGFDSIGGFEALARVTRERRVPVVVMKAGRSARGQAATLSHTASIAGSDAGASAFLKRLGFARATGIPEFLEALKVLHVHGPIDGPRVGVLCCSGGEASVVADAVDDGALALPELACEQAAAVRAQVHPLVDVANPLDYHTFSWGDEAALGAIFAAFADPATFDATLLVLDFPRPDRCDADDWQITLDAFHKAMAETGSRGMIVATLGENMPEGKAAWLVERGVAPLCGIREALAAIECAATIGGAWRAPISAPLISAEPVTGGSTILNEADAKSRLAAFGVEVPSGQVVGTPDEALSAARLLGGAVALKALGLAHKTEQRALRLRLSQAEEIRTAAEQLLALSERLLVERFTCGIVAELIVGLHRDPELGLMLTLGSGGVLVELLGDSVTLLLPVNEAEVRSALAALRCAPLLAGHRGRPPADIDAAVAAIIRIADFATAHRAQLQELDVNPLAVLEPGRGAVALDALVRLTEEPS